MSIDIVTLAQRYSVRPQDMRRSGHDFYIPCICPERRRDSNPSVRLYVAQESYWCYACNRGGTIVHMIAHAEGISLREAYRRLREMNNGYLPPSVKHADFIPPPPTRRTTEWGVGQLARLAAIYHQHLLQLPRRHAAWRYLAERGVSEETVRALQIGWAPAKPNTLFNGLSEQDLVAIGALNEHGNPILRSRLTFPIWHDDTIVYLIGRHLGKKGEGQQQGPSYIGLRTTEHVAKAPFMLGSPHDGSVLVEGIMDAIAVIQAGLTRRWRVIATLGFDRRHVEELITRDKIGRRLIIALDQDQAGRSFALQLAAVLRETYPALSFYIVTTSTNPLPTDQYPVLTIEASFKDFGDLLAQANVQLIQEAFAKVGRPPLVQFMQRFLSEQSRQKQERVSGLPSSQLQPSTHIML